MTRFPAGALVGSPGGSVEDNPPSVPQATRPRPKAKTIAGSTRRFARFEWRLAESKGRLGFEESWKKDMGGRLAKGSRAVQPVCGVRARTLHCVALANSPAIIPRCRRL